MLLQDISDLSAQLRFLQKSYTEYMDNLQDPINNWPVDGTSNTKESFEALESKCNIYGRWVSNYRDRTNFRINLVRAKGVFRILILFPQLFYLANQREATTQREIAESTAKVAEQTRQDSASMITIAAVTMLFLPGKFVSAILSTTFFNYGSDGLMVSRKW